MDSKHWRNSDYAEQFFQRERPFLSAGLRQAVGPKTLQIADLIDSDVVAELDLPFCVTVDTQILTEQAVDKPEVDALVDPAFLPFSPNSLSTVVLPHVLEWHTLPHQVLREVHRVLMSEGHVVLTGFNPVSVLGLQRFICPRAVFKGHYYTPKRVMDWLQLLEFDVVASAMFQYAPLSRNQRLTKAFAFLESMGDRWLPMVGGGYMIVAKKRDIDINLVGQTKFRTPKVKLAAATVKAPLNESSSRKTTKD